ncbi:MAG: protein-tyrosine kinase [Acidobacteriota bacterium]|jgi:capsular exopolysaccharide synthesis family protein|nr:protein-tyrosine kinase [Acidobacteriota bacterium]
MGRVYDALKRASSTRETGTNLKKKTDTPTRRKGTTAGHGLAGVPPAKNGETHPWDSSPLFARNAAHDSASTAHTEEHTGSALSGVKTSRAAGATLDAAGTTRVRAEFVSLDISATRVEPHLVAITQPRSAYCEQYRSLRTRILQAGERKKMQAFVITSSNVAEGKTLTALNLAWLLAQTDGISALLIDSDLRQPCAGEYLGIDTPVGLSEVLSGDATLEEAIIRLQPANLHFLPGGAARDDVAEILSGPRFGQVLSELRTMFDYIIIDAPPMGIFTDANVLINRADGALVVVRSGKTRYAALDRLLEQLPRERILGVVLNRTDEQLDETSYYYQRRYSRRGQAAVAPAKPRAEVKDEEGVIIAS